MTFSCRGNQRRHYVRPDIAKMRVAFFAGFLSLRRQSEVLPEEWLFGRTEEGVETYRPEWVSHILKFLHPFLALVAHFKHLVDVPRIRFDSRT